MAQEASDLLVQGTLDVRGPMFVNGVLLEPPFGGGVEIQQAFVPIPGGPFTTLNFVHGVAATAAGFGIVDLATSNVNGTGDRLAKFSGTEDVIDSSITDNGSIITVDPDVTVLISGGTLGALIVQAPTPTAIQGQLQIDGQAMWGAGAGGGIVNGVITPAALPAGVTSNYSPPGLFSTNTIRQAINVLGSSLGGIDITAFGGPVSGDGTTILLINLSGAIALLLVDADAGSVAANRFLTPGGVSYSIAAQGSVLVRYDGPSSRWRVVQ